MAVLMQLDHIVDRLLCVELTVHQDNLKKAKKLIQDAGNLIMKENTETTDYKQKIKNYFINKISTPIVKKPILDEHFHDVDPREDPLMAPYYSRYVMYSNVKLFFDLTENSDGFDLRMSRGFIKYRREVRCYKNRDAQNAEQVKWLLEMSMFKV
jgi:hypothetical protein